MRKRMACAAAASLLLLAACRVGPKYKAPAAPVPQVPSYKEATPAQYKNAPPGTWQPASPQDAMLKGKWWEIFREPELNALEEQLNIDNQNIAEFFQNFMAARALVREARSGYFPVIGAAPSVTATRSGSGGAVINTSTAGANTSTVGGVNGNIFTNVTLPLEASWAPDLFGRVRNTVAESRYNAQVSAADLENERLLEQASLAVYYFELRGQDWLQDVYNRTIEADREALHLTQLLVKTGIDSPQAEVQAEETLRAAEAAATGVGTNRAIYEHAIATLIGKPATSFGLPVRPLTTPPPPIPIGVPSQLLERRPDIAAAERAMASANAAIGVAVAAYYPSLNLSGSAGVQASPIGHFISAPSYFWSVGALLAQTIYNGGLRGATVDQFTAQYNADVALYRQTVLTAFQQVEDYLAALRITSAAIAQQEQAVRAAQEYLDMALARYKAGIDPYLNVINAQLTLLTDQTTLVGLRVAEMVAAVQLIEALGGGWDRTRLPTATEITSTAVEKQLAPGVQNGTKK